MKFGDCFVSGFSLVSTITQQRLTTATIARRIRLALLGGTEPELEAAPRRRPA